MKKISIFDTGGQLETILYEKSGGKNRKKTDFTAIIAAIFTFFLSKTYKQWRICKIKEPF